MMGQRYILQIDEERNFFVALRRGLVIGTEFPSVAAHLDYVTADELCRRVRDRGYKDAVVCSVIGEPVVAADLEKAQAVDQGRLLDLWDEELSVSDWELMRLATTEAPEAIAARFGLTLPELAKRLQKASETFDATINSLHKANQDSEQFRLQRQAEHAARRSSTEQ